MIGKGGSVIRALTEETGTNIELDDDGTVRISAVQRSRHGSDPPHRGHHRRIEVNRIYEGKVVRLADFGAFVNILPGKDGLVHHLPDHRCPRAERGRLPENR